jgi:hypothetical protein
VCGEKVTGDVTTIMGDSGVSGGDCNIVSDVDVDDGDDADDDNDDDVIEMHKGANVGKTVDLLVSEGSSGCVFARRSLHSIAVNHMSSSNRIGRERLESDHSTRSSRMWTRCTRSETHTDEFCNALTFPESLRRV